MASSTSYVLAVCLRSDPCIEGGKGRRKRGSSGSAGPRTAPAMFGTGRGPTWRGLCRDNAGNWHLVDSGGSHLADLTKQEDDKNPMTDLPRGIGAPAPRALTAAGYTSLERLNGIKAADVTKLHGVGPKAIRVLTEALREYGFAFTGP
jgi:hypothetical protein